MLGERLQRRTFALAPGVCLGVEGPAATVRQFDAEYGRAAAPDGDADVAIRFEAGWSFGRRRDGSAIRHRDTHRWLSWSVALSEPSSAAAAAVVRIGGHPRSVVTSMVQGYVVEPLVSLVAPSVGQVLVPAAAIRTRAGLVLVLGPSGAGKSSVSARAMASGVDVFGDDQVFVDARAVCRPLPRRIRIYPDLETTARAAWDGLPADIRARLAFNRVLGTATRGRLRPSLPVDRSVLGPVHDPIPTRLARVLVVEPRSRVDEAVAERIAAGDAIVALESLLRAQRRRFDRIAPPAWREVVDVVARRELEIVADALVGLPIARLRLPAAWPADRCVDALAEALGVGAPPAGDEGRRPGHLARGGPDAADGVARTDPVLRGVAPRRRHVAAPRPLEGVRR